MERRLKRVVRRQYESLPELAVKVAALFITALDGIGRGHRLSQVGMEPAQPVAVGQPRLSRDRELGRP